MDHKNLMFGDWVRSTVSGKAYQVLEAGDPFIMVDNPGGVWLRTIGMKHRIVEPIPLTAEVLEKNGWMWDNTRGEYVSSAFSLEWDIDTYEAWLHIGGEYTIIPYVHELQHALRLCGLNELADNFKVE